MQSTSFNIANDTAYLQELRHQYIESVRAQISTNRAGRPPKLSQHADGSNSRQINRDRSFNEKQGFIGN